MYEDFYDLSEKPFNVTPDPRFLYLGEHHQEALAHLIYGINDRKGFVVITGEVGTGKTTLIHTLLERLDPRVKTALVFNPNLTLEDFFLTVFDEFELMSEKLTKAHFLIALNNFLLDRLKRNENAVLIVDEAQNLPLQIMEEIRLLLNLETSKEKLLQIVLSGQPELNQKLALPELRQLRQRISIRYHIPPLSRKETKEYVQQRLRIAGSQNGSLFSDKAIDEIHSYSKGIPRLINILGDNSLLLGYAEEKQSIDHIMVRECISDLELHKTEPEARPLPVPRARKNVFTVRAWRLAFMLITLIVFVTGYFFWDQDVAKNFFFRLPWLAVLSNKIISTETPRLHLTSSAKPGHSGAVSKTATPHTRNRGDSGGTPQIPPQSARTTPVATGSELETLNEKSPKENLQGVTPATSQGQEGSKTQTQPVARKEEATTFTLTVKRNDSLSKISLAHYGIVNDALLKEFQKLNPQITDIDYIGEGWELVLPTPSQVHPWGNLFSVHVGSFDRFGDAHALFSRLVSEGYEVYLIPVMIPKRGQWYRVTVGRFEERRQAFDYANQLLTSHAFAYAQPIPVAEAEAVEIEK